MQRDLLLFPTHPQHNLPIKPSRAIGSKHFVGTGFNPSAAVNLPIEIRRIGTYKTDQQRYDLITEAQALKPNSIERQNSSVFTKTTKRKNKFGKLVS